MICSSYCLCNSATCILLPSLVCCGQKVWVGERHRAPEVPIIDVIVVPCRAGGTRCPLSTFVIFFGRVPVEQLSVNFSTVYSVVPSLKYQTLLKWCQKFQVFTCAILGSENYKEGFHEWDS